MQKDKSFTDKSFFFPLKDVFALKTRQPAKLGCGPCPCVTVEMEGEPSL